MSKLVPSRLSSQGVVGAVGYRVVRLKAAASVVVDIKVVVEGPPQSSYLTWCQHMT